MVSFQKHLPEQAEEEWWRTLHGEMSDDVVFVGHGLPLPVLLLYVLLQVEAALLRNVVLLEERLHKKGGTRRYNQSSFLRFHRVLQHRVKKRASQKGQAVPIETGF